MITNIHELKDELEALRQKTLPSLWSECMPNLDADPVNALQNILMTIKRSTNMRLHSRAADVIKEHVSVEVSEIDIDI